MGLEATILVSVFGAHQANHLRHTEDGDLGENCLGCHAMQLNYWSCVTQTKYNAACHKVGGSNPAPAKYFFYLGIPNTNGAKVGLRLRLIKVVDGGRL